MVYTVTLNPALDRTLYIETLLEGEANRIKKECRYAGGKGIDVSRVLLELGVESILLGFIGGYTGAELDYVEEEGGNLHGFEIKYSKIKKNPPKTWVNEYKTATYKSINKDNYLDIIL